MTRDAIVLGLGQTGLSCIPYLAAQGYRITVCDSRAAPPGAEQLREENPQVFLRTGPFDHALLQAADLIVASPGVSIKEPAIAQAIVRGVPVVGDIELFLRACAAPVIAITGSNGKSTVTMLVGALLDACGINAVVAGNIGVPVLPLLQDSVPDVYVLELSSFQLETTTSLKAKAAVVLNISPDHMDRYRDLTEYAAAKARIYAGASLKLVNREDPCVVGMVESSPDVVSFGLTDPIDKNFGIRSYEGGDWLVHGVRQLMPVEEIPLAGHHNVANVLAAFGLALSFSDDISAMRLAVRSFQGLPHRTVVVGRIAGVTWIDDSKGTNVGATVAALEGLGGPVVLIAGGDGKGADFSILRSAVAKKARAVVLIGRDGPKIAEALAGCCSLRFASDMNEAVRVAQEIAQVGDSVLLSPACASFDMFRNYSHRGEVFTQAVQSLVSAELKEHTNDR